MKDFDWSNIFIWGMIAMYFFNGFDYVFTSEKTENKAVISVEKKPEKTKEDKDTIKTDW